VWAKYADDPRLASSPQEPDGGVIPPLVSGMIFQITMPAIRWLPAAGARMRPFLPFASLLCVISFATAAAARAEPEAAALC